MRSMSWASANCPRKNEPFLRYTVVFALFFSMLNYSKTNIDVMDDKQYARLLTYIIKESVNDI